MKRQNETRLRRACPAGREVDRLSRSRERHLCNGLLDRLGIAEAIKSKVTRPDFITVSELVAKGEVKLGMVVITQILTTPVDLRPAPARDTVLHCVYCGRQRELKRPDAAMDMVKFLIGPIAIPVIRAEGMEPGETSSK